MKRFIMLATFGIIAFAASLRAATQWASLIVNKPVGTTGASVSAPIANPALGAAGFSLVRDYPSRTLFRGPASLVDALVTQLQSQGVDARRDATVDSIELRNHVIDIDSGIASPSFASSALTAPQSPNGMYLVALVGYPAPEWLTQLANAGVMLIEPIPPATYLAYGPRAVLESLTTSSLFVRRVFYLTPAMKTAPLETEVLTTDPFRAVEVEAFEPTTDSSLQPLLAAVAEDGNVSVIDRLGTRVHYSTRLTDLDISLLSLSENVFVISASHEGMPSSERQAQLIAQPIINGSTGAMSLPLTNSALYDTWLKNTLFSGGALDLSTIKVGMLDTGFDNGILPTTQPDFVNGTRHFINNLYTAYIDQYNPNTPDTWDDAGHGTISSSVITGWPGTTGTPPVPLRADSQQYRYGMGIAPGVQLSMVKIFQFDGYGTPKTDPTLGFLGNLILRAKYGMNTLDSWGATIMNHSYNNYNASNQCGYDDLAQALDIDTRAKQSLGNAHLHLHVVSAGNLPTSGGCTTPNQNVYSPATAKTVLAVGATNAFSLPYSNVPGNGATCQWDNSFSPQDARNIPSFSAIGSNTLRYPPVKPDLVAPGVQVTGPKTQNTTAPPGVGIYCSAGIVNGGVTYELSAGTSFAAPAVSGAAALVTKWYKGLNGVSPTPAMLRAILTNGALDTGGPRPCPLCSVIQKGAYVSANGTPFTYYWAAPNYYEGWGMLNFSKLFGPASNYAFYDEGTTLTPAAPSWNKTYTVVDGSKPIRIMLVWDDRYTSTITGSTAPLVNFLDVTAGWGFLAYHGNAVDGYGYSVDLQGSLDSANSTRLINIRPGTFTSGGQINIFVNANSIMGDGVDPAGTTLRQKFSVFAINVH